MKEEAIKCGAVGVGTFAAIKVGLAVVGLAAAGPVAGGIFAAAQGAGVAAGGFMALAQSFAMGGTAIGTVKAATIAAGSCGAAVTAKCSKRVNL